MVVPFDQNSMKVVGEPTALTEGMRLGLWGSADLAVSATGTLVYATGAGQGKQELVWVTRDGRAQAVDPDWTGDYLGFPALSPNGKWLAVGRVANAEPLNIWIKRLDRGSSIKWTLDGNDNFGPAWTPDGRSVTFSSAPATGATDLWTERADGGAPALMQVHEKRNLYNAGWSPDGKWLIFRTDVSSPGSGDILAIRPGIDTAPVPVVATTFTEMSPALSPNGRWLAYVSNETGADEIYVVPFPNTGAGKWAISAGGGTEPLWSHRGGELFYRAASGNLVAVAVNTNPRFSLGRSAALFSAAGFTSLRFGPQYAVAPDDRRFLMIRAGTPDKLSTLLPRPGGAYVFLREAYGDAAAFVFGWLYVLVTTPTAVGSLATVFAEFLLNLLGIPASARTVQMLAIAAIMILTFANVLGARVGAAVSEVTTLIKVTALAAIILGAFLLG